MSFRLTYATMFNPPEAMHERFELALAGIRGGLGRTQRLYIDGRDVDADTHEERVSPIDRDLKLGRFPMAQLKDVDAALAAASRAFPAWRATSAAERRTWSASPMSGLASLKACL